MPEIDANKEIESKPAPKKEKKAEKPVIKKAPAPKKVEMDPEIRAKLEAKLAFMERRVGVQEYEESLRVEAYRQKGVAMKPEPVLTYRKEIEELREILKA